jgi:hypothetical protein
MTIYHIKAGVQPISKTLCVSDIPQKVSNVQHTLPAIKSLLVLRYLYRVQEIRASTEHISIKFDTRGSKLNVPS